MGSVTDNAAESKGKTAKHTPGPWDFTDGLAIVVRGRHADGRPFQDCIAVSTYDGPGGPDLDWITTSIDRDAAEANARRIAACVNACDGIPTEQLEYASGRSNNLEWLAKAIVAAEVGR